MQIAIEKGRQTRPDIKLGICGEHGGEPDSVKFCHKIGLSYVSCSPYRVPVARLAAAQAAIEEKRKAAAPKAKKKWSLLTIQKPLRETEAAFFTSTGAAKMLSRPPERIALI